MGDIHAGAINATATRRDKAGADLLSVMMPSVVAHVQTGDFTESGTGAHDTIALDWMAGISDAPWYNVVGNHDIWGNIRSADAAAAAFGMPGKNYTADLGFAKLIVVGPDNLNGADNTTITLSAATLSWLNAELVAAGSTPCLIACHAPLFETVGVGQGAAEYRSDENGFYVQPKTTIATLLADNPNAKAWLAGHTHSPINSPGFVTPVTVGGHVIASINSSSIYFQGRTIETHEPMHSVFVTYLGPTIEVRYRNHGAGIWDAANGVRVATVTL